MSKKIISTPQIPEGFTQWNFNIDLRSYYTFAWFGELFIELDGEYRIIGASGTPMGDHGDFRFRLEDDGKGGCFSQAEANRVNIIAYKTDLDILYNPKTQVK